MATKRYEVQIENESREEHYEYDTFEEAKIVYDTMIKKEGVVEASLNDLETSEILHNWTAPPSITD